MSFDLRDIRRGMDVFSRDTAYLGNVLAVHPGQPLPPGPPPAPVPAEGSVVHGELLGPMPTQPIGNTGPLVQSFRSGYATAPDDAVPIGQGTITVGKWWGLIGRRIIPIDAILSVSFERVILRQRKDELGI